MYTHACTHTHTHSRDYRLQFGTSPSGLRNLTANHKSITATSLLRKRWPPQHQLPTVLKLLTQRSCLVALLELLQVAEVGRDELREQLDDSVLELSAQHLLAGMQLQKGTG